MAVQDRTAEFHTLIAAAAKRNTRTGPSAAHQRLLAGSPTPSKQNPRGDFARRAAGIGRSINDTMSKLERLAMLAKRKALFDDKPVEIAELTYVIKHDLSNINAQISSLQAFVRQSQASGKKDESAEHSKNVVMMLQGKLADVSVGFKEVLEVRTKNIQASRQRTEQFVSGVRPASPPSALQMQDSQSPLYLTSSSTPRPLQSGLLSINPPQGSSSQQQLALMEEGGSNSYISARSEAIETIEKTITELGSIFHQLATMVGEQTEMIQRIDHDTMDVAANVEGGQRELLKYWGRVSSNRWLFVKMFGVLMIFFLLWVLVS